MGKDSPIMIQSNFKEGRRLEELSTMVKRKEEERKKKVRQALRAQALNNNPLKSQDNSTKTTQTHPLAPIQSYKRKANKILANPTLRKFIDPDL